MNKKRRFDLEGMTWTPGQGPDPARLRDLIGRFSKPQIFLGEAWFMGETRLLFDDLNAYGIAGASDHQIEIALDELISGLVFFPGASAWPEWYGYFTPLILSCSRFLQPEWHAQLCTGLLSLSLCNPEEYVTHCTADFAAVLSPWIMNSHFWREGRYLPLQEERDWRDSWGISGLNCATSISLFLTWRHLHPNALRPWLHSVLAIEDAFWRAHFAFWLIKVWPVFQRREANFAVLNECHIKELWCSGKEFRRGSGFDRINMVIEKPENQGWHLIPPENIMALWTAIREEFDQGTYFDWIDQFSAQPELWPQMEFALEQMQQKFLSN